MQSKHATDVYTSVGPVIHNRNDAEVDSATFSSSSIPMMICNSFVKHEGANNPQIHPRPIMMPVCHAYASPEPTHPTSMDTQLAEVPSTASRLPASSMEEGLLNISYGHGQNPQCVNFLLFQVRHPPCGYLQCIAVTREFVDFAFVQTACILQGTMMRRRRTIRIQETLNAPVMQLESFVHRIMAPKVICTPPTVLEMPV